MKPGNMAAPNGNALPPALGFLAPSIVADLVRVGNWGDGGYVVPYSAVRSSDFLVSCGISRDWSFEAQFHQMNPGAAIHGYDHTVSAGIFRQQFYRGLLKWLIRMSPRAALGQQLWLWREFRAFFGSAARHFQEKIVGEEEADRGATLDQVFARISPSRRNVFLKIDIEGSEYGIIDAILRHAGRVTAVVIEFHDTQLARRAFCDAVTELQREFEIVHLHGNNCAPIAPDGLPEVLEITFVRQTGLVLEKRRDLPIDLDRPNAPGRSDYAVCFTL